MRSQLSYSEYVRLENWVKENTMRLKEERPAMVKVAIQAGGELGLSLSPSNVRTALRNLGCAWIPIRQLPKGKKANPSRILAKAILLLNEHINAAVIPPQMLTELLRIATRKPGGEPKPLSEPSLAADSQPSLLTA